MISFRNVYYTYPGSKKQILNGASFVVEKGDFAVIKGMTGAGKSTILDLLTCSKKPDDGEITFGDFQLTSLPRSKIANYRRTIGCVFQDFKLLEEKTVSENVAFALEVQRKFNRKNISKNVSEVLERVGMKDESDHFPRELSLGGKQRIAIARALVSEPLLLLADGATAQLDDETAYSIFKILADENLRGMTIMLTTTTDQFNRSFPRSTRYFELEAGKVDENLPVL